MSRLTCVEAPPQQDRAQECTVQHIWAAVNRFFASSPLPLVLQNVWSAPVSEKLGYNGDVVSRINDKVLLCWPGVGTACLFDVSAFVSGELRDDLADPHRDSECGSIVKAGHARGLFVAAICHVARSSRALCARSLCRFFHQGCERSDRL